MGKERIDAKDYWGLEFSELKYWQKAEILSANWFIDRNFDAELMPKCFAGYDILVDNSVRIDVKWSSGKNRNKDEMQFNIGKKRKKAKGKTTDYYLLCFHQVRQGVRQIAGYLVPWEFFDEIDYLTITRQKVGDDLNDYKLSMDTIKKLGINSGVLA